MSSDQDPTRFSESAGSPELRQLFQTAREDLPSSSKLEGLWARIEPLAGPVSGTSPSPSPAAPSAGSGAAAAGKVLAVVAALGAAGVAAYFLTRAAPVAPPEPRATVAAPAPTMTATASPTTASPAVQEDPGIVEAPKTSPSSAARAPVEGRGAPPPSKAPVTDASAEAALLERAREAIATDPKRALAITREHARRFPKGILAQEREVIAIDALKRLGKGSEADSRVDQFKKTYPGSAHQHGLDSATNQR